MSGAVTGQGDCTGERPPRAAVVFIVDTEGMMQTMRLLSDLVKPGAVSCSGTDDWEAQDFSLESTVFRRTF